MPENESVGPTRRRGPYRKSDARRREIIDAAFDVFATAGFRGGSLKDIGARIGIDPSTILHHFGSKENLLLAVLEDKQTRDAHSFAVVDDLSPEEIPGAFLALAERNGATPGLISLYAVLSAESTTTDHPGDDYFRRRTEETRAAFRIGFRRMADGGLLAPGVDPDYAATSTFALWDGIQIHWLIDPATVRVTDALRAHLRVITTVEL
ncbi:TetR/AcrR family transcriptional regulator [Microbacterium rhizomatis]|uniref:TetR/AcrR family transcriptional regulator n=1 Tax=Microbacterium rhizomatis TaxID=1631477 RepID=A0A5J5J624_9MICO|nr:TetR/AcrR family transcriptional regulator [Microbacterium rhizomatis]KAA9110879.1 TetR/AcrR family transcriptional regulator [Microbacterium rhizomatis]